MIRGFDFAWAGESEKSQLPYKISIYGEVFRFWDRKLRPRKSFIFLYDTWCLIVIGHGEWNHPSEGNRNLIWKLKLRPRKSFIFKKKLKLILDESWAFWPEKHPLKGIPLSSTETLHFWQVWNSGNLKIRQVWKSRN